MHRSYLYLREGGGGDPGDVVECVSQRTGVCVCATLVLTVFVF